MTLACDCHVHIVGDERRYPWVASRAYSSPPALLDTLLAEAAPCGIGRFVIVQPSFYGTDNSATLDAVDTLGDAGRAVAVIDPGTSPDTLREMHDRGVRGLRINLYSVLATPMARLEDRFGPIRDVAGKMGWHVQVIAKTDFLTDAADMLAGAGVPVVIDHYGLPRGYTPASAVGQKLLALIRQPNVWVKLSAPSRVLPDPMAVSPPADWLGALIEAAPDRCVWGSDWPHTPFHDTIPGEVPHLAWRPLSYTALAQNIRAALPAGVEQGVLVDNPARLYGFS